MKFFYIKEAVELTLLALKYEIFFEESDYDYLVDTIFNNFGSSEGKPMIASLYEALDKFRNSLSNYILEKMKRYLNPRDRYQYKERKFDNFGP